MPTTTIRLCAMIYPPITDDRRRYLSDTSSKLLVYPPLVSLLSIIAALSTDASEEKTSVGGDSLTVAECDGYSSAVLLYRRVLAMEPLHPVLPHRRLDRRSRDRPGRLRSATD